MGHDPFRDMIFFHAAIEAVIGTTPAIPSAATRELRVSLITEEVTELLDALSAADVYMKKYPPGAVIEDQVELLAEIADGAVDSIVVILGTLLSYGIDFRPIWDEITLTNCAKASGLVREDGKRLKPEGWKPPRVAQLLLAQREIVP